MGCYLGHRAGTAARAMVTLALVSGCLCGCRPAGLDGAGPSPRHAETPLASSQIADVHDTPAAPRPNQAQAQEAKTAAREARASLDAAVAAVEEDGHTVSYIIVDLKTGESLEYQADIAYYCASTIKAPFCISLVREQGGAARSAYGERIIACLVNSDNEAYRTLRSDLYGQAFFPDFCRAAGVSCDPNRWYADYSVRDLASLWGEAHPWLASDDENAKWIANLLDDTLQSRVDDTAPDGAVTWSKAGWYSGGGPEYDVTFDAGIVRHGDDAYAIAVATSRGSDFGAIERIERPLTALWLASQGHAPDA